MCDIFGLAKRLDEESSVPCQFDAVDKCLYYPSKRSPICTIEETPQPGQFYIKTPFSTRSASETDVISTLKKSYEKIKDKMDSSIIGLAAYEKSGFADNSVDNLDGKKIWSEEVSSSKEDIDHPECHGKDSQGKIKEITDAMQDLLLYKNEKYGDSVLHPIGIFTKHLRNVPENTASILVRLDDKLGRVKNADELRTNDVSDIIGYCTLLLISMGVSANDIAKFKD